jgi:hypothetical protein
VNVDVDLNQGGDDYIYQLTDGRLYLVVWVDKARVAQARKAIASLAVDTEAAFGTIRCGEGVWIVRDQSGYAIAIGNTDSKDVSYRLSDADLNQLLHAGIT